MPIVGAVRVLVRWEPRGSGAPRTVFTANLIVVRPVVRPRNPRRGRAVVAKGYLPTPRESTTKAPERFGSDRDEAASQRRSDGLHGRRGARSAVPSSRRASPHAGCVVRRGVALLARY